jgi:hypothetical protein
MAETPDRPQYRKTACPLLLFFALYQTVPEIDPHTANCHAIGAEDIGAAQLKVVGRVAVLKDLKFHLLPLSLIE